MYIILVDIFLMVCKMKEKVNWKYVSFHAAEAVKYIL